MVNRVTLIGNLGQDPEVRYAASGTAVCSFSLATTRQWKDKNGEQQKETEWHKVSAFGRTAEVCGEYLKKGAQVYIEGRLQTRKWQDKETGADRYSTEIVCENMKMLGGRQAATLGEIQNNVHSAFPGSAPLPGDIPGVTDVPF